MSGLRRTKTPDGRFGCEAAVAKYRIACLLACWLGASPAIAQEKPPLKPDQASPLTTPSRVVATIEIGLPALASAINSDVPRRLATFDERVNCVHRRVLAVRVNADCVVAGYVERTGPVSLSGRGDRLYGAVPIFGAAEGRGANRVTKHIAGKTEARATVEVEARPQVRPDWSLDLDFNDSFHWTEPPYLHILGRDISLARYVEPRIREQMAHLRARATAEAQRLDLHGKAESAWRDAFKPIKLADKPDVWLQLVPQSAAFSGVRADTKVLEGSLQITGTAETFVGHTPNPPTPTPLPPLGGEVTAPSGFEVITPVHVDYDTLRQEITKVIAALPRSDAASTDVQVYPSSGKLVVGLRTAKPSNADPNAGWVYVSAAPKIDNDKKTIGLSDLSVVSGTPKNGSGASENPLLTQLRQKFSVSYADAYQRLLAAANERLVRPLQSGFRMEGHLTSAKVDNIQLLADGLTIALRAGGDLKIVYQP